VELRVHRVVGGRARRLNKPPAPRQAATVAAGATTHHDAPRRKPPQRKPPRQAATVTAGATTHHDEQPQGTPHRSVESEAAGLPRRRPRRCSGSASTIPSKKRDDRSRRRQPHRFPSFLRRNPRRFATASSEAFYLGSVVPCTDVRPFPERTQLALTRVEAHENSPSRHTRRLD
jgi:hypothetical protein